MEPFGLPGNSTLSMSSGSNKRQRTEYLRARVTPEEKRIILEKAKAHGGISQLFRVAVLNARPRPSQVDQESFAKILALLGDIQTTLAGAANNLNQLTHYAHMDRLMPGSIIAALDDIRETQRDLREYRTVLMNALGFERQG